MSPFAHPLFTMLTGLAFGIAATSYPRRRPLRLALPFLGLATAVLLHSIWNAATTLGDLASSPSTAFSCCPSSRP